MAISYRKFYHLFPLSPKLSSRKSVQRICLLTDRCSGCHRFRQLRRGFAQTRLILRENPHNVLSTFVQAVNKTIERESYVIAGNMCYLNRSCSPTTALNYCTKTHFARKKQSLLYPVSSWLHESAPSGWQLVYALLLTSRYCTTYDVKCASSASTGARHSSAMRPGDVATTLRSRALLGGSAEKKH